MLKVSKLRKNYKNQRVLYDVNLEADKGDIIAVIGSSGCGKSTLLKCINGLIKADGGQIFVDDMEVTAKNPDLAKIRESVGIVFQQYNLFPHMNVKQNIILAPLKVKKVSKNEAEKDTMILLGKVGMLDKMDAYPAELSGGQAQRAAIARSLIMKPKLMLFDEPTSALDPKMTKEVIDTMLELKQDGMTMIVVTHEIGFAKEAANKVVFMDGGTIIESGSPDEIFTAPKLQITRDFLQNILK